MSVLLLVEYADGRAPTSVPVATQGLFDDTWLRLARELGLVWMPAFSTGAPVPREDIPDVLAEFARMAAAADEPVKSRALGVVEALREAAGDPAASVWIG